jgi:hypothetical protein
VAGRTQVSVGDFYCAEAAADIAGSVFIEFNWRGVFDSQFVIVGHVSIKNRRAALPPDRSQSSPD